MPTRLFSLQDLSPYDFIQVLDLAEDVKGKPRDYRGKLKHHQLAYLFKKESMPEYLLLEAAVAQLGGALIHLPWSPSQDEAQTGQYAWSGSLGQWVNGWIFSGFSTSRMLAMAEDMTIPVLNASSEHHHPCRVLSDFYTIREARGSVSGLRIGYIGSWTNLCLDLILAALYSGTRLIFALPDPEERKSSVRLEGVFPDWLSFIEWSDDPTAAADTADVVYLSGEKGTATEDHKEISTRTAQASFVGGARFPEIGRDVLRIYTDPFLDPDVFERGIKHRPSSLAAEQVKNQLHVQKAIMLLLLDTKR
ncbi:MAG: hypothetical protein KJ874_05560 [Acidobacteria bacterium]|nr:hypothetical protein [Acidobacteriota bacterium]